MKVHDFNEIGFSISRPDGWLHTPPAWARRGQERLLREEQGALSEAIRNSPTPFFHLHKRHASRAHAYPTVQAKARPNGMHKIDYPALLADLTTRMAKTLPAAEILVSSDSALLSGHRALFLESVYGLESADEGESFVFECASRVWVIPTRAWVFTVGFTAPADPEYACGTEMDAILESIRIR